MRYTRLNTRIIKRTKQIDNNEVSNYRNKLNIKSMNIIYLLFLFVIINDSNIFGQDYLEDGILRNIVVNGNLTDIAIDDFIKADIENNGILYYTSDDSVRYFYRVSEITEDLCYRNYLVVNLIDYQLRNRNTYFSWSKSDTADDKRVGSCKHKIIQLKQNITITFSIPENCNNTYIDYSNYSIGGEIIVLPEIIKNKRFNNGNYYDCHPIIRNRWKKKDSHTYLRDEEKLLIEIIRTIE